MVTFLLTLLFCDAHAQAEILLLNSIDRLSDTAPVDVGQGQAEVAGYFTPGDGGGGSFDWIASSTLPADGVLIFQPVSKAAGRWVRRWSGGRLPAEFAGARGDGQADDEPAFVRLVALSKARGAFTIELSPGKRYYLRNTLDLSVGAPGLTMIGPASPRSHTGASIDNGLASRLELDATTGATVKLGVGQVLRDLLIWRHGLQDTPSSLADVRYQVSRWFAEDGGSRPRSIGVFIPFDDATVDGVALIGFHTGVYATGSRFKLRHLYIDAAGYAIEVANSKDTSIIEDVQTRALWSNAAQGRDELGDHSYRPGTAFYVHDSADGLQINSVMAIGWVNGIVLAGSPRSNNWLISLLQPNIETPANGGRMTAAIKTTGEVRRVTIVDPRIVAGGLGAGPSAAMEFRHTAFNPTAAANNNVTVIGGTLEIANEKGVAVILGAGSTGAFIGTTMNLIKSSYAGPLVRAEDNIGRWDLLALRLSGHIGDPWIVASQAAAANLNIADLAASPNSSTRPSWQWNGTR